MITTYKFPINMNTSEYDITADFFEPLLNSMKIYYRGVGYFSSTWLRQNSQGLLSFVENNGRIKWITSPILSKEDLECFILGEEAKQDQLLKLRLEEAVEDFKNALDQDTLSALAWMLADNIIEIRLAVPCGKLKGEFHDKFGYFEDNNGNSLSFNGSNNESYNGQISNYESFTIFYSWHNNKEVSSYSKTNKERFLRLWENEDENLRTFTIPNAIKEKITKLKMNSPRPYKLISNSKLKIRVPGKFNIRDYQQIAYQSWCSNNLSGIFAMATGTGKTVTALYCALKEFESRYSENENEKFHILILVPTKTLVEQWSEEVKAFNFFPVITAFSKNNKWKKEIKKIIDDFRYTKIENSFVIISTYTSFVMSYEDYFRNLPNDTLLIADELHNMGSETVLNILNRLKYNQKIGLSATPKRIYSPDSSDIIESFFRSRYPYTFRYTMKEAIENNILSRYNYYIRFAELSVEEFEEYCKLTKQIINLSENDNYSAQIDKQNKQKLIKRKRIINGASEKKEVLLQIFNELKEKNTMKYCLVYTPGGNDYFEEQDESNDQQRIIEQMQTIIKDRFPKLKQSSYLGETKDREQTINSFRNGNIDVLFAINCLDEGVDIPRTEIGVFTSSSGNPRQYIQRRGRLLRKHDEKDKAEIYDIFVIPPTNIANSSNYYIGRNLIINELKRARYFLELSEQKYSFYSNFEHILHKYQIALSDVEIDEEFL